VDSCTIIQELNRGRGGTLPNEKELKKSRRRGKAVTLFRHERTHNEGKQKVTIRPGLKGGSRGQWEQKRRYFEVQKKKKTVYKKRRKAGGGRLSQHII